MFFEKSPKTPNTHEKSFLQFPAKLGITVLYSCRIIDFKKNNKPQPFESRPLTTISESRDTARYSL